MYAFGIRKMNGTLGEDTQQLLRRFTKGDEQAFRTLYHHFYNRLLLYGSTITSNREIVEDQIQEVFAWLYAHPQQCQSVRNLASYLFLALRKNIRSALQKENNQQAQQYNYSFKQPQTILSPEEDWVQCQTQQQQEQWLAEQMDQLPARMKEVVYLRYYQCLSYREIARIMSVTPQVAQNFATRALKKMRQSLPQLQRILSLVLTFLLFQ